MAEINIARQLLAARHEKKITQEELATYIGVSKAAVSKWESGSSFPDITILPQLATYFNMTIDELMGYEPQMTKEDIRKTYHQLKKIFAVRPWEEAMTACHELEKKYYACFPFLLQLIVLYLNHASMSVRQKEVYGHCIELAQRVQALSEDVKDARQAVSLETMCHVLMGEPMKALDLLGKEIRPMSQDTELLGQIYQSMGKNEEAEKVFQIAMYQHLIFLVGDSASLLLLRAGQIERVEEVIQRTLPILEAYQLDTLHPNTAAVFYLTAAQVYGMNGNEEACLRLLNKYVYVCEHCFFPMTLHGDDFFDAVNDWFQEFDLGNQAPRSEQLIQKSMLESVEKNPGFAGLKDNREYQKLIKR